MYHAFELENLRGKRVEIEVSQVSVVDWGAFLSIYISPLNEVAFINLCYSVSIVCWRWSKCFDIYSKKNPKYYDKTSLQFITEV